MDDCGSWDRCKPQTKRKTTRTAFDRLSYAVRIVDCERPENVEGPSEASWAEINFHLGTKARSLSDLVKELGLRTFGHSPRVGDSFCGGGSIPFEAARIGCTAFGSDLNPVAGLLTWASLNLLGGSHAVQESVMRTQAAAIASADQQITEWGVEHNEEGERADAYLYCVEVKPDGCDYFIPLAPSWVVGEKLNAVVQWKQTPHSDRLEPCVKVVSSDELKQYKLGRAATIRDGRVYDPFNSDRSWSIDSLRGVNGLRHWAVDDLVPRADDVFQERLYCIRWVNSEGERRYASPNEADLQREQQVLSILKNRFSIWQRSGFIPSMRIASGYNTEQPD